MAINAFDLGYDESGEGNSLIVSLQLSTVERAKKLKKHWHTKLGSVEYFHSKEFNNFSKGVFAGLNRDERLVLLDNLGTLVHRHIRAGFTVRMNTVLYEQLTTQDFRS